MSIKLMGQVWDEAPCEGNELLVLLAFADFADDEGFCWPSQSAIAKKCRVSESTVKRSVQKFVKKGIMTLERYRDPDGKLSGNNYRISLSDQRSPEVNLTVGHQGSPQVIAPACNKPVNKSNPPTPLSGDEEQEQTPEGAKTPDPLLTSGAKTVNGGSKNKTPSHATPIPKNQQLHDSGQSARRRAKKERGGNIPPWKPQPQRPEQPKRETMADVIHRMRREGKLES